ncbi:hypothetical protein ACFPYI_18130 [Halomarina salina]|uniref:XapX domain-containing protein n=1 Tax=Halomarina salina TaxID=1872699 RepID=A0ABD5RS34_9EURY|nr:hypothetical protein [Halomarina salina]
MSALTLVALSDTLRTAVAAAFVATALFVLFTLFAPDPTDPTVTPPALALAVGGGVLVAHRTVSSQGE